MIVGDGLLARAFASRHRDDDAVLVFASGVANSGETRGAEFERERGLFLEARARLPRARVVYFSTCSIDDPDRQATPYVIHKQAMEALAREAPSHLVARLPQVVGDTPNPHTLTNALRDAIVEGRVVHVWQHAERNLIDVDDVAAIVEAVLADAARDGITITVAGPESIAIPDLVRLFERVLGRTAKTHVEARGAAARIDASEARRYAERAGVSFAPGYIERVVRKYYGPIHD